MSATSRAHARRRRARLRICGRRCCRATTVARLGRWSWSGRAGIDAYLVANADDCEHEQVYEMMRQLLTIADEGGQYFIKVPIVAMALNVSADVDGVDVRPRKQLYVASLRGVDGAAIFGAVG